MDKLGSIPVMFSQYASSEPRLVPGFGVVCRDKESLRMFLEKETTNITEVVEYHKNYSFMGYPQWVGRVTIQTPDGQYYGADIHADTEEDVRKWLPDMHARVKADMQKSKTEAKTELKVKTGAEYWKMLEDTAKLVDTWPEWKKG